MGYVYILESFFQQIILHVDVMLAYIYLEKNQLIQEK